VLGYHLAGDDLQHVFDEFKKLADKKKEVYDADVAALIEKQMTVDEDQWKLVAYEVHATGKAEPSVSVTLDRAGETTDSLRDLVTSIVESNLSLRAEDQSPMPANQYVPVTIPLYYQGHGYRAASRIRVTISAPNGDQPIWAFAKTKPRGSAEVAISSSKRKPSKLTLPVVGGIDVPTGLPPCPGLRGEPCRAYAPIANSPAKR